jgi:hypothetical protein
VRQNKVCVMNKQVSMPDPMATPLREALQKFEHLPKW